MGAAGWQNSPATVASMQLSRKACDATSGSSVCTSSALYTRVRPRTSPITREMRKITRKMYNNICAIPAAAPAMPAKPNTAAISAITRKVTAQPNIALLLLLLFRCLFRCSAAEAAPRRHALRIPQRHKLPIKLHFTGHEHRLPLNLGSSTGDLHVGVLLHVEILAFQVPCWPNLYTRTLAIICLHQHLHTGGHTGHRSTGLYADNLTAYGLFLCWVIEPTIGRVHAPTAASQFASGNRHRLLALFIGGCLLQHLGRHVEHQRLAVACYFKSIPGYDDGLLTHSQKAAHRHYRVHHTSGVRIKHELLQVPHVLALL